MCLSLAVRLLTCSHEMCYRDAALPADATNGDRRARLAYLERGPRRRAALLLVCGTASVCCALTAVFILIVSHTAAPNAIRPGRASFRMAIGYAWIPAAVGVCICACAMLEFAWRTCYDTGRVRAQGGYAHFLTTPPHLNGSMRDANTPMELYTLAGDERGVFGGHPT